MALLGGLPTGASWPHRASFRHHHGRVRDLMANGSAASASAATAGSAPGRQAPALGPLATGARLGGAVPLATALAAAGARGALVLLSVVLLGGAREVGAVDVQVRLCHESVGSAAV